VFSRISLRTVSLGLLRFLYGYWVFSQKAARIDLQAQRGGTDPDEVLLLWRDYHLARASAPMLPTIIWRWKKEALNDRWNLRNSSM